MRDISPNDPSHFDCALFEGSGLNSVKVDSLPPSIIKGEPYAIDEIYLSNCCSSMTLMMSMPPMGGVECDMDVDVEIEFKG